MSPTSAEAHMLDLQTKLRPFQDYLRELFYIRSVGGVPSTVTCKVQYSRRTRNIFFKCSRDKTTLTRTVSARLNFSCSSARPFILIQAVYEVHSIM
jgi:hypothetical protein